MLGRRLSNTPLVDDRERLPFPGHSSRPEHSTFQSPEGTYQLAYEIIPPSPPPPATTSSKDSNAAAAAAAAAANALPEHPATISIASITFPSITQSGLSGGSSGGGGLLGLGGSQRNTRTREASFSASVPTGEAGGFSPLVQNQSIGIPDEASSSTSTNSLQDSGGAGGSSHMQSLPSHSPAAGKRKPLMSLPSMTSMPLSSFGGGGSGQPQTPLASKPKSAFRGTNSTFVKSYEGLPLSGRVEKLWAGPEPREVTLAVFTSGKAVIVADISPRAKTRVGSSQQSCSCFYDAKEYCVKATLYQ